MDLSRGLQPVNSVLDAPFPTGSLLPSLLLPASDRILKDVK
jgi:hypothetical protein